MSMPESNAGDRVEVLDVQEEQLARVYAKAFLGAAEQAGKTSELVEEADSLVEDVLNRYPEFETLLTVGEKSHEEIVDIIDEVFTGRASEQLKNLLKVMSHHHRLKSLRLVVKMISKMYAESQGRQEVTLKTAHPLDPALVEELRHEINVKLSIDSVIVTKVDPKLLAGMVIQVGDKVYDGSVRTMLERTRRSMVEKAIDAIESLPERFVTLGKNDES